LTTVVRRGVVPPRSHTREREKRFIKGMANIGSYSARETARALAPELASARRLLDIGGGPAVYACTFARSNPALRVTVLDLPGPLTYARETIAREGMRQRVTVRAADAAEAASYGRGYDIVFMSNFLHSFKRPAAQAVVEKAARALAPGGVLAVKDFYVHENRTAPAFAAIFSLNMLVADAGDCYSRNEISAWMHQSGIRPRRFTEVAENSGILIGTKESRDARRRRPRQK
jgi:ubiquinone/menaquinone biosynthesis C-methylase UbiE